MIVSPLAGCGSHGGGSASSGGAGDQQLVIVTPNGREIQAEFTRLFTAQHPGASIKWINSGGTADNLREVEAKFKGIDPSKGIGDDLFFGGGAETFLDLEHNGLLQPLPATYDVPDSLNGVPLHGANNDWVGSALSGFGILANQEVAQRDHLPAVKTWADLADPRLFNRIELADSRHSGSAHVAYEVILQSNGWDRGWQILTAMAGNARIFASSASQLPQDVANGEAVYVPSIDFYARTSVAKSGGKLAYIEPAGQLVVTPDPIGILQGAPHLDLARQFVATVMSPEGQKLWMLPKGAPGGPQQASLYRMPALPALYNPIPVGSLIPSNPFAAKNTRPYDSGKAALRRKVLDDLLGAVLVDNLALIKARWQATPDPAKLAFVPVTEAQVDQMAAQWKDLEFAKGKTREWSEAARQHFGAGQ